MSELPVITPDNYRDHVIDFVTSRTPRLRIVTASEIKAYIRCPSAWFRKTMLKQVTPETTAQKLGSAAHTGIKTAIEDKSGIIKPSMAPKHPVWRSAQLALDNVGAWGDAEWPITGNIRVADIPVWGRIDLLRGTYVFDWKTIASLTDIPPRAALIQDPQRIIYSRYARLHSESTSSLFEFVFLAKDEADYKGLMFESRVTDQQTVADWLHLEDTVEQMKRCVSAGVIPGCTCGFCKASLMTEEIRPMEPWPVKEPKLQSKDRPLSGPMFFEAGTQQRPGFKRLDLYIDCVPLTGRDFILLAQIIQDRTPEITDRGDLRAAGYQQRGTLAASLRKNPPSGKVVAFSGDLANVAIEALIPIAEASGGDVIKGF